MKKWICNQCEHRGKIEDVGDRILDLMMGNEWVCEAHKVEETITRWHHVHKNDVEVPYWCVYRTEHILALPKTRLGRAWMRFKRWLFISEGQLERLNPKTGKIDRDYKMTKSETARVISVTIVVICLLFCGLWIISGWIWWWVQNVR